MRYTAPVTLKIPRAPLWTSLGSLVALRARKSLTLDLNYGSIWCLISVNLFYINFKKSFTQNTVLCMVCMYKNRRQKEHFYAAGN